MEKEIIESLIQFGTGGAIVASLYIVYLIVSKFIPNFSKNTKDIGVERQLEKIGGNHLVHIQAAIEKQTEMTHADHMAQNSLLIEIATILRNK